MQLAELQKGPDMNRESLLDTIQRLLALSASPNEHEATLALAKAHELMLRHNLSMAEIDKAECGPNQWVDDDSLWWGNRPPSEQRFVVSILTEFFFVKVSLIGIACGRGRRYVRLTVFGRDSDVRISRHVFAYLSQQFRRLWETRRRSGLTGDARDFYAGLQDGLAAKLRLNRRNASEASAAGTKALMRLGTELEQAYKQRYAEYRVGRPWRSHVPVDEDTYVAGWREGAQIELRQALGLSGSHLRPPRNRSP